MKNNIKLPKLISHRGAKSYAPENTLSAFKIAKEAQASWVEFDVQMSSDQKLFILHDDDVRRTTNGKGLAREHTLAELKELDAGSWFKPNFANEKVPTLEETINYLCELKLSANIEIKACGDSEYDAILALKTCEFLEQLPSNLPIKLLVSSFSFDVIRIVRKHLPDCPIAMLLEVNRWPHFIKHLPEIKGLYQELGCCSLNLNHNILTKDRVRSLDFAEQIAVYTVNKPDRAKALFAWGVNSVFSDHPDLLKYS
ncbi:MAG: glycerophosphodiester phosphodiesterase [Gammaproteobacteria bacterium]|nr:glycerophosphodiester phosphodiesterase [Gammaproteobacteria bacterium]